MLRALTRRVLDDSSDAEEVLQEVFLQVWNEAGCYNPDRYSVSTWLVLITRRRAIDRLRSRCGGERAVTATQREG
jgi:RNA polymerase sigma-70 factor (ECF subfamily)